MSRVYTTDAIVLRRGRFGENGALLTLFTPEYGKVDAIAKGMHRSVSKMAGHLEPLLHVRLFLAKGRNLDVITQAQVNEPFGALRSDLYRTAAAWYAVELVDHLSEDRQENRALFDLLLGLFRQLEAGTAPEILLRFFEMRLLTFLGFRPSLERCAQCGTTASAVFWFSPGHGGVLCPTCAGDFPDAVRLSSEALALLRFYQTGHLRQWEPSRPSRVALQEAASLLRATIRTLDERGPRSLALLDRVRPSPNDAVEPAVGA